MKENIEIGLLTAGEYLEREKSNEQKHEFFYGKLVDMPGNTLLHDDIKNFLAAFFNNRLRNAGFRAYTSDVKVEAEKNEAYFYPDVVLADMNGQDKQSYLVEKPVLIAEILSNSTRSYDAVDKYIQYRKIPTLQYYLLVEPETMLITCLTKQDDGEWLSNIYTKPEALVPLEKLNVSIRVGDVYGV
jgi:Uma2 family endonuclease